MTMPFSADETLRSLKDFQRRTVEYVFHRMFLAEKPTRRFLVADEVGLGKTMVARGVIAKTLEHLKDSKARADFVYICSNAAIAHQNVARLNVLGQKDFSLASRLTLLPLHVKNLAANRINFVSFTPGTAFDLKSQGGWLPERILIFRMLLGNGLNSDGLANLLHATARSSGWANAIARQTEAFDPDIAERYIHSLRADEAFFEGLRRLALKFKTYREDIPPQVSDERYAVIGELRQRLARICLEALTPRLVIVDEFQRFRHLLQDEDPASELAHALFDHKTARVLLLSATPYKMLSLDHEKGDDHYPDFLRTLGFLFDSKRAVDEVKSELDRFRRDLLDLSSTSSTLQAEPARDVLQRRLQQVMCRTERVASTTLLDAMTREPSVSAPIEVDDLAQAVLIDGASLKADARDSIEYWKSTPYALNFMKGYELRRNVDGLTHTRRAELVAFLQRNRRALLTKTRFKKFAAVAPANARLRALMRDTTGRGLWRVLWLPPSLPAWEPAGPFKGLGTQTKSLVFSAWNVVPDAIASLCSYEAERLAFTDSQVAMDSGRNYETVVPRPLRFRQETDGSPTGMTVLLLMHPSPALAGIVDPVELSLKSADLPSQQWVLDEVEVRLDKALRPHLAKHQTSVSRPDERWYWAAVALLDGAISPSIAQWLQTWRGVDDPEDGESKHSVHVAMFIRAVSDASGLKLGPPPADLARVLASLALASPAVCALRSLKRSCTTAEWDDPALLSASSSIGVAFQSLLNVRESVTILRDTSTRPYWELALQHGLDGNLGSLLDEQVHVLVESLGVARAPDEERVTKVAAEISNSLSIRAAPLSVDEFKLEPNRGRMEAVPFKVRCQFALRFGDLKDEKGETRAEVVRSAFNSPFRPFVLASTSVGQEGLDFHVWCHAIVHWNLPSNPVDMEQREGRVHRYKGHAVRKNVASAFGRVGLSAHWEAGQDPWKVMFELAKQERGTDLKTFWLFETEGGARIERRVPLLPLSRDEVHLQRLKRGLALYRLVFGQPRQEELLTHLGDLDEEQRQAAVAKWRIDLTPPAMPERSED
ncbi:helicase-related protein [Pelomonas sp. SE-A7]|uniref:DEAD/DEAH box helicase n=1 Tax=Pelomonas sp. SE-A7 TaxID=3054953 RepID=UPI00259CCF1E|nr:helicase-related protein [Pelomonas sp. SE-A7]MDM4766655.1 helicase-related protein [Pelomonas sp. SE-A7]